LGRRFFEALLRATQEGIRAVTWEPRINLAAFEQQIGEPVARANPDARRVWSDPFLQRPEHGLLVILRAGDYDRWYHGSTTNTPAKENYVVVLPDEVRKAFKAIILPPPGYELQPLKDIPASAARRFSCTDKAITDMRLVAEYISQGHLRYTKAETVAVPSLRFILQATGGPEFFENADDGELAMLRTRMLVEGLAFAGEKDRENLLVRTNSAEPLRDLFPKLSANAPFLHEKLLAHLVDNHRRPVYDATATKHLGAFYAQFPPGKWISWENIRTYHRLREHAPTLFRPLTGDLQASARRTTGSSWGRFIDVNGDNQFELVSTPLLKGYAFFLAALGLAEITFDLPANTFYCRHNANYLTPYDGLCHVRLTPLGEFVFGRRTAYEVMSF